MVDRVGDPMEREARVEGTDPASSGLFLEFGVRKEFDELRKNVNTRSFPDVLHKTEISFNSQSAGQPQAV